MKIVLGVIDRRPEFWMAVLIALSWLGEVIHNRIELPDRTLLSPEHSLPALVSILLFLLWVYLPVQRMPGILLLAWAVLHLVVGAIVTMIPLKLLPFSPEQSLTHYLAHLLYGLAQIPLMALILKQQRQAQREKRVLHHPL